MPLSVESEGGPGPALLGASGRDDLLQGVHGLLGQVCAPKQDLDDAHFKQGEWEKGLTQAWSAPPVHFARVLASAEAAVAQGGAPPHSVARWLREEIGQRVPGWQRAWLLLERLLPTAGPG